MAVPIPTPMRTVRGIPVDDEEKVVVACSAMAVGVGVEDELVGGAVVLVGKACLGRAVSTVATTGFGLDVVEVRSGVMADVVGRGFGVLGSEGGFRPEVVRVGGVGEGTESSQSTQSIITPDISLAVPALHLEVFRSFIAIEEAGHAMNCGVEMQR